jgi:leucyl/phenylalanyl-tRNA--protein transferase
LAGFHLPRRLRRTALSDQFQVFADRDFRGVIAACAEAGEGREDTWINRDIERLFTALHDSGHAHSVEAYQDGKLVGGLYGVVLGAAFFGESMFSRVRDASKVALVHLVARLRMGGFQLLDTQFVTAHLSQFGAREVPRAQYKVLLDRAASALGTWIVEPDAVRLESEIRAMRQGN